MRSKTILTDVNGWTPLIDTLVVGYGLVGAAVFGVVWRHCQMRKGECFAAQDVLAKHLGIARQTFNRYMRMFVIDGYFDDLTPGLKNRPHNYKDTGKAGMQGSISSFDQGAGVALNDTNTSTTSMPDSVSTVNLDDSTVTQSDKNTLFNTPEEEQPENQQPKEGANATLPKNASQMSKPFLGSIISSQCNSTYNTFREKCAEVIRGQDVLINGISGKRKVSYARLDQACKWYRDDCVTHGDKNGKVWVWKNVDAILERYDRLIQGEELPIRMTDNVTRNFNQTA